MVKVRPTEVEANQVLQAVQNTNAAACIKILALRLQRNLPQVATFGAPRVKITQAGTQAIRVRIQMPLHMRVHRLRSDVPPPTTGGAVAIPQSKVKDLVSDRVVGKLDAPVYYDQFYMVRGRVVIVAGFVSIGAPFTSAAERRWLRPMRQRAQRVPIALSSPPGTIILPPPTVTPTTTFSIVMSDSLPPPGAEQVLSYPSGWAGTSGPPVTLETCTSDKDLQALGITPGQTVRGTNVMVVLVDCPPPVVIVPAPVKKCKPSVLDYIDLSYMYVCGNDQPKVPVGPGAAGTGQMPLIIAFPGLTWM
jgi:hypothetical protein